VSTRPRGHGTLVSADQQSGWLDQAQPANRPTRAAMTIQESRGFETLAPVSRGPNRFRFPSLKPWRAASDFTLMDQTANSLSLSSLRGQRVVIYFTQGRHPWVAPRRRAASVIRWRATNSLDKGWISKDARQLRKINRPPPPKVHPAVHLAL